MFLGGHNKFFLVEQNGESLVATWREVDTYVRDGWEIAAWCEAANRHMAAIKMRQGT